MNNLRATIDILFRKLLPNQAINSYFNLRRSDNLVESAWKTDENQSQVFYHLDYYSHNELGNVWQKVQEDWALDADTGKVSVFGLLHEFGKNTLKQIGHDLAVDYPQLLRWRELSHLVGEDLLTTCFLAQRDKVSRHQRTFFAWRPVLSTNNHRLKVMLEKGVAENHFHLQGSAPHSQITWIALMNRVTNRKKDFKDFLEKGKLEPETSYGTNAERSDLYVLVLKAAYIRLFLFQILQGVKHNEKLFSNKNLEVLLNSKTDPDGLSMISNVNDLQREINSNRILFGKLIDPSVEVGIPDYCIPKNIHEQNFNGNILLCGERKFLYDCFQAYFQGNKNFLPYADLFYAYLLIKSKFREEMIQVNKNVGFSNFQNYQNRKKMFLTNKREIYLKALNCMAVQTSKDNQAIESFETRIPPQNSKYENREILNSLDKACNSKIFSDPNHSHINEFLKRYEKNGEEKKEDFFYVPHFIKKDDKVKTKKEIEKLMNSLTSRDSKVRQQVKVQAQALVALRNGINQAAKRIYGIDAASSEFSCRPEAFAQAYRFLKYQRLDGRFDQLREKKDMPVLKATFHAGEDFYDVVDGLRAIDEAIKFLNLEEGDRLGHALALGINPREYYEGKHKDLMLPKQWHLDNISWLISRINKYNLHEHASYASYLQWEFRTLFNEIYGHEKDLQDVSPELYYEGWKLRGDDPTLYSSDGKFKEHQNITFWQRCAVNEVYPDGGAKRKVGMVNKLYYLYHFDVEAKNKGAKIKRFEVKNEYIKVVESVQKHFQLEVAEKHLGIETNPSSNYLIGTFKRYDKHPLVNFYNLGLELDPQKLQNCPQLFVSINTDDQGVFNTYLENEYALMALALEKMEDEDGKKIYKPAMIYDWLDRIRQMGLEMSFKQE
ncbi:hypothetical protein DF185_13235 [Marinifilum breve]|uniref:adenosine deaminase n=1 Tax=Marinifilum breve TaxID=2184082 RepID=A0A2V3ZWZ7_9BACT|nr:hypothetical protein [Marinifilum breve]PXY00856.1 hypothetical protein DF185_13235 [Marinifilum breve]